MSNEQGEGAAVGGLVTSTNECNWESLWRQARARFLKFSPKLFRFQCTAVTANGARFFPCTSS
jgi:hypothetical protein